MCAQQDLSLFLRLCLYFRFAENRPPRFSSNTTTISGKIGQQTVFSFSVSDADNDQIFVKLTTRDNSQVSTDFALQMLTNGRYQLVWTPTTTNDASISIEAGDSKGTKTFLHLFSILCACLNGGECTEVGANPDTDQLFQLQECYCQRGNQQVSFIYLLLCFLHGCLHRQNYISANVLPS